MVDGLTVAWLVLSPFESVSYGAEKRFADAQARSTWVVGLAALLAAGAVAFWVSRRLLRPVQRVAEAGQRLAGGDDSVRVPQTEAQDEIGQLGRHFDHLASGGAGLCLSICRPIVDAHERRIEAAPSPLGGLCLRVELPAPA